MAVFGSNHLDGAGSSERLVAHEHVIPLYLCYNNVFAVEHVTAHLDVFSFKYTCGRG
jgi:hypothetical protein